MRGRSQVQSECEISGDIARTRAVHRKGSIALHVKEIRTAAGPNQQSTASVYKASKAARNMTAASPSQKDRTINAYDTDTGVSAITWMGQARWPPQAGHLTPDCRFCPMAADRPYHLREWHGRDARPCTATLPTPDSPGKVSNEPLLPATPVTPPSDTKDEAGDA